MATALRVSFCFFFDAHLWCLVGYNKITGLHFMSGRTEMGYEVG